MAFDETLASRIRQAVGGRPGLSERKMFGGLCFMVNGNMFAGVVADELMLRVGPERFPDLLMQQGARPMDFTGRPMKGFLYVGQPALSSHQALSGWLDEALAYAEALPPKQARAKKG